jgi:flagella basal body P-ring formation protein FlgA
MAPSPTGGRWLVLALAAAAAVWFAASAPAAELRLRAQCTVEGPVVKLGDVAEILGADRPQADRLAAIELFAAPLAPQQRFLRIRELQDLLLLRGINLTEHSFSGSSQVAVQGRNQPAPATEAAPKALPPAVARKIHQHVCEAVTHYLKDHAAADQPWIVEAELGDAETRAVADAGRNLTISGGNPPWIGAQRFLVSVASPKGPLLLTLDAQVSLPETVVVAARGLARGAVIHQSDVELAHASPEDRGDFHAFVDVIGKEATQAIAAGKPLTQSAIRPQVLVRRGEVVTVWARASGIRIRTMARARDDGGDGELVAVETLTDRGTFFARVSGIREVEVYARAPRAEVSQAGQPSSLVQHE